MICSPESLNPWGAYQIKARSTLRKTTLTWTEIQTGYFLDYWGIPFLKTNMSPDPIAIDVKNRVAAIPGTGEEPVSFTYTYDVARFIAEKMLPEAQAGSSNKVPWEDATIVVADRLTWNKFLALVKNVRGGEWQVTYDSDEALADGKLTELPCHIEAYSSDPPKQPREMMRAIYTALGRLMAHGIFDVPLEKGTNTRYCASFEMLTVEKMLSETWGKNPAEHVPS